jgi:hypothetical protein
MDLGCHGRSGDSTGKRCDFRPIPLPLTGMRSFLVFLLGIIAGVVGMLFLPELTSRREQLNQEMRKQLEILEGQVRDLGDQLKKMNPPKSSDDQSKQPSAAPSATAH